MIPAAFNYEAPTSLDDALNLLAANPNDAKILAGGHSLLPAMKLRLAQPALLVDIGRIKDLSYIREQGEQILIGAMTTHYELESSTLLKKICPLLPECASHIGDVQVRNKGTIGGSVAHADPAGDWPAAIIALESSTLLKKICPLLPECASHIGDVQVRNKGTIGGSVAHADPAGDWPAAIIALEAEMVAVGKTGDRVIKAADFFVDLMTTALDAGEILREIRIPKPAGRFGHAYQKVRHPASGFAVVGVAVALQIGAGGECERAGIGVTGVASKAYRAAGVEQALQSQPLNKQTIAAAATHATDGVDANSDLYASEDYRRHLAQVYTRRAIEAAFASAS